MELKTKIKERSLTYYENDQCLSYIKEAKTACINMEQRTYITITHNHFMALLDYVRDYPGQPAPERQNQEGKTDLDLLK